MNTLEQLIYDKVGDFLEKTCQEEWEKVLATRPPAVVKDMDDDPYMAITCEAMYKSGFMRGALTGALLAKEAAEIGRKR